MTSSVTRILSWMSLFGGALAVSLAGAAGQLSPAPHDDAIVLTGTLSHGDYERLIERRFEVPASTRRIAVDLEYTGQDRRTVIDLGLRGPSGLRGWSGGGRAHIEVSALTATPGYLPGPIETGPWAVLLGVPNIRPGSDDRYTLTVHRLADDTPERGFAIASSPGWYAGDLHSHSMHSDGRARAWSGKETPAPPFRVFEAAASAGLDFLALTDHNTVSHWLDVDRLQPYFDRTLLLHARELTTYRGHATVVGERRFNEFRLAAPDASPAALLGAIASHDVFISINHPTSPDDETCMGCGWNVIEPDVVRLVQGVEVVNGDGRGSPAGSAWMFWANLLNRGFRLTAVGGSDDHTVDDPRDRALGVPSTVVRAVALSEPGVVAGLRAGRAYVRVLGDTRMGLEFWADHGGERYDMGAVVPGVEPHLLTLHAALTGVVGQRVEWIRNAAVLATDTVDRPVLSRQVSANPGDWFSLRVSSDAGVTLLSNAVYVAR